MVTFAQSPPNSHLQQTLPTSKITLRAPISPPYETPPDKSPPDDHRTTTRRSFCSHHRTNPLKQEIVSLYKRFCQLDCNAKGFISADEFLSVPEFAMNPLSQRLLKMVDGLNFKDFVIFLSTFNPKASMPQKIERKCHTLF
ncbi:putative EF-hand domain-containing protein [Helianthus debilis subsp. tardiflorus]